MAEKAKKLKYERKNIEEKNLRSEQEDVVSGSPSSQRAQTSECKKKTCQTGKKLPSQRATKKEKSKNMLTKSSCDRGCWPHSTPMTLATATTPLATCCIAPTAGRRKTPETHGESLHLCLPQHKKHTGVAEIIALRI